MIQKTNGWTALHIAAYHGHTEVLTMLCETENTDLNPVTKNGWVNTTRSLRI